MIYIKAILSSVLFLLICSCNDITHNHGETNNGNTHDVATCTDKSHNHGTTNNSNNHNGGGHHK